MKDFSKPSVVSVENTTDDAPKSAREEMMALSKNVRSEFTAEDVDDVASSDELNDLRNRLIRRASAFVLMIGVIMAWGLVGGLFEAAFFANVENGHVIATIIRIVVFLILGCIWAMTMLPIVGAFADFESAYKRKFVLSAFCEIFDDVSYRPLYGIPEDDFRNLGMIKMGNSYSSDDYIRATYKGVDFEYADVRVSYDHKDDGDMRTEKLFWGSWMTFEFNKDFVRNVQVVEKGFNNAKHNRFIGKSEDLYEKIDTEDVDFNSKFGVFAQSEHDAFYILTPHMMETIKSVAESTSGKMIFCFVDNKLHVGICTGKDSFGPDFSGKLNADQIRDGVFRDIKPVTTLVDELCLDRKLFKA